MFAIEDGRMAPTVKTRLGTCRAEASIIEPHGISRVTRQIRHPQSAIRHGTRVDAAIER
jgi:hypothetical protein